MSAWPIASRSRSSAPARPGCPRRRTRRSSASSHVLLESERHAADTIYKYQKGKYVMAEPSVLPLRSPLSFAAGTREAILGAWDAELAKYKVNLRHGADVTAITRPEGRVRAEARATARRSRAEARRPRHRPAGQPAQARRARRGPAGASSTSSTIRTSTRTRPSSSSAPATPRSRTRSRSPSRTA